MSIKKYNTYFKEENGKIYYYDENGEKKYVPSTAFSNLQEQIDAIGKPLTYSGSKSVTEINTLEEIKIGTVYTITGEAGNITAGNVDVKQGDEIAWGGSPAQWFNIGKDKVDSWKTWSEEHGSSGVDGSVYIGKDNSADAIGINIGADNQILNGDDTLGASINLGKNLTNRYGVLIGQNIESTGYGFGLGSDISYIREGDIFVGYNISADTSSPARLIFGRDVSGNTIREGSMILGQHITGEYVGCDSMVMGHNVIANVDDGSMLISQLAYYGDDTDRNGTRKAISADNDSMIIGGYSNPAYVRYYFKNPGISAYNNGIIFGQGQNMTASNDSLIFGHESYANYASKIIGNNGWANNNSMVINWPSLNLYSKTVPVILINNIPVSGNVYTRYKSYRDYSGSIRFFNYYYDTTASVGNSLKITAYKSNQISNFKGENINGEYYAYFDHYYLENTAGNYAVAVYNIKANNTQYETVTGNWDTEGKIFTENAGGTETAYKLTGWEGHPYILINNSGTVNFYDYFALTSAQKEALPKYYKIRKHYDSYDVTAHQMISDGRYLYVTNYRGENGWSYSNPNNISMESEVPSALLQPNNNLNKLIFLYNPSSFYVYDDDTFTIGRPTVTGYECGSQSASNISFSTSSVYPSAIFATENVVTDSTADNGSLAIGSLNKADNGSVALNTNFNYNTNNQHNLVAKPQSSYYSISAVSPNGVRSVTNQEISYYEIVNEPINVAQYNSISLGVGTKGGWMNSAYEHSLVIGSKSTATYNSFAIGRCASANEHSFALGHSNGCTAYNFSYSLGGNGCNSEYYSYALGHDGITSRNHSYVFGTHGVYAENNGFAFGGQGITARNQGIAIGFYGVQAENIDSNGGGYGQGWGIAIGSNGITSRNGGIAFGYNGVYSENRGCIAIGSSGVNASGEPSIAIGSFGTYAYNWGLSIGAKGRASNQSINFSMGSNQGSFTTAENGSINMLVATNNCNTYTNTKSITIKASNNGYALTQYGSISINANTEGWFGTTAYNQSIILATKSYSGEYGSSLGSYNNSIILGAGIQSTSARNDSISIGGGKIIDNSNYSQQVYNGSVAIGYGNIANGGVFVQGSRNVLGTTYTSFDNRPIDYTQSIVFGDSNTAYNYRPYLWANKTAYSGDKYISAYISTDSKKTPHGNGSATYTKNMIVGNFNYVVGYNSFTFGLNNTAGCPEYNYNSTTDTISGDKNDDGFTFVFGLNNYARRNYDMAIGFGTSASGGENIAIGTLINGSRGTEAIGYKNISIRSVLSGIGNIGIEAVPSITASGSYNNLFKNVTASNIIVHQNVADNILYNVLNNSFISTGTYGELNRNIFNSLRGTNLNADGGIDRNIIRYTDSDNFGFSSNFTDNIINYSRNSQLGGGEMHKNILWNTDNLKVVASQINDNILLDIGNKSSYDKTNISLYQLQDNIIRKSSLINSLTSNGGVIDKNFLLNTVVSLSGNNNGKGIDDGHWNTDAYITNSFIVGTVTMGSVGESFSFGGMGNDYSVTNTDGVYRFGNNTRYNPILQHVQQTFNFGDNTIVNTQSVITEGCGNEIYGAENSRILGETNGIVSNCCNPTWSGWNGNGSNVMEATVIGTCNFMGQYSAGSTFTNNTLIGQSNDITVNNIIPDTYPSVTNNTLIGSYNAQLEVYDDLISFTIENGIYNYFNSAGHDSKYNILNAPGNYDGISFGQQMSGYGLTGQSNRNVILGNHSVIGSNINDSTLIGNSNTIAALAHSRRIEILQTYSANAEPWESGKQTYVNNCCSYENDLYWRKYDWNLTAAPTASNSWWVKIEGPNDITTAMFEPTISNNFGAGSYNLLLAGSNQVNIGSENITSGHNATAIGEGLRAKTSQFVIGRFNEELDGTNGLSADNIDSTSGTLFIVGNGKHKISDYRTSAVERSNAMIVSANGLVSASNLATSGFADIDATLSTLTNFGTWEIVTGTTTADITTPNSKTIYLIKNTTVTGSDQYEEWICTNTATPAYEKIGDTSIDLSQYVPLTSYQALENRVAQLETLLTTYSARWVLTQV